MIKFLLDYSSGVPVYRQIIDQIIFGIASGQLKLGEQLPTVRALATGTFINKTENVVSEKDREDKLKEICMQFSSVAFSYGFNLDEVMRELKDIETSKK